MKDPRMEKLSKSLINYSCRVEPHDNVLIEVHGKETTFVTQLIKEIYNAKANPFVLIKNDTVDRALLMNCNEKQMDIMAEHEELLMSHMNCYIGVRSYENFTELSDVPGKNSGIYYKHLFERVHTNLRVPKTRWVVLRYPSPSMAQSAGVSTENFEDFYFNVCNLDYKKMSDAMTPLKELMEKTDRVHIVGKGTDLEFSIKGLPAVKCDGLANIPDGEVYSAPVKNSVNGCITYNTPSVYQGYTFENIHLEFKDGKIVKAESNNTEKMNKIFDTDEGARYVGEFSFGLNPYILKPLKETLFDEKISGSIHFTPGASYDDCFNGNKSAIHWDLVYIQRPEYGGGEIYFDDRLIRKDGLFVPEELKVLNPENLK